MQGFSRKSRKSIRGRLWLAFLLLVSLWAVARVNSNTRPANVENICSIFEDKRGWYKAAQNSEQRWGTPKHVQMSIIRQESSFLFDARPPRTTLFGFIPWKRPSNAYGYAQALERTWRWYKTDTGRRSANRDNFGDAIDFVGWYTNKSKQSVGISKWDPYNQYLAYHEGQTGWRGKTYEQKAWLKEKARIVDNRARKWWVQLEGCEENLNSSWWVRLSRRNGS
jgi:hypothetical protein